MDPNQFRTFQWQTSGVGLWLTTLLVLLLLGAIAPAWLINGILILLGLMFLAPLLGLWWLRRSLVQGNCPVCQYPLSSLKQIQVQCPSCGEVLKVQEGRYERITPPGTVDVTVVEVEESGNR